MILLRSSATNADAAQRMQHIFTTQLQPLVATLVPAAEARLAVRADRHPDPGRGVVSLRLRLPPVVKMSRAEIVDWVGPTIQRYLGLPESVCG